MNLPSPPIRELRMTGLQELAVPVLVVTGDDDRIVPTDSSVQLASTIPGAQLDVFDQCGHVPQEECPDQFMDAMITFLKGVKDD